MDSAGFSRYLLAVAAIAVAISLCCAAAVVGGTGRSPGHATASAPSSPLSKSSKFPVIYTYDEAPSTHPLTSPGNKQHQLQKRSPKPSFIFGPYSQEQYYYQVSENKSAPYVRRRYCREGEKMSAHRGCIPIVTDLEDYE